MDRAGRQALIGTVDHTRRLVAQLRKRDADVAEVPRGGEHAIDPAGVAAIAGLLACSSR